MSSGIRRFTFLVCLTVAGGALAVGAVAATAPRIENGGFEINDLTGWQQNSSAAGDWTTYKGHFHVPMPKHGVTPPVFGPFPKPPRGTYAAVTEQGNPSTQILSQVFKVPAKPSTLQFFTYYQAYGDFATPHDLNADTDDPDALPNEQYRVDLMKPSAPIRSLAKDDVLKNLFRTRVGDPDELRPTKIKTSLEKFAGEKVRLRFAVAVNENELNAGIDGVKVKTH